MHSHEVGRLSKFPFKSRGSILLCGIFFPPGVPTRRTCSACLDRVVCHERRHANAVSSIAFGSEITV